MAFAGASEASAPAIANFKSEIAAAQPDAKRAELAERLTRELERIASGVDGSVSYLIVDLTSGERFARRADEPFPTASAIKIGILHELFVQADAGRVRLDDPRPLPPAARVGGSGILQRLSSPQLSLRDHAMLMILLSDNSSTNVLIDALGMETITSHMQALGATGYRLRRRMMDAAAAARGEENVASASDLVVVMDALRTGRGLTSASQAEATRILREYGPTAIRAGIPADVQVAAKPGGLDGVRTEVAWVDLKGRPYLICVMTSFLVTDADGDRAITELSRTAYQYFSRLARAGVEGRLFSR
ncbi:beta-lactamase [Luteitalea sp. TBR-22]|uniref:serine hydrolase n=1 Tax=Luteitalea sp. TBR-22 TaxID=2802971 RepID=UPI001AF36031|nr:serine hydrolase [Luteitalea sp. TBR-22]BCS36088.1 beta-lactamase [Luteitalea sp. TBR-22]